MPHKYEIVWHNCLVIIPRLVQPKVAQLLEQFPAVALLGPRQVGKTTLALSLAETLGESALYLDFFLP
jgi:predicted AAA+ superfamily ATPase